MSKQTFFLVAETQEEAKAKITVNRETGLVTGLKALGHESKNGDFYPESFMVSNLNHYNGLEVYYKHGPLGTKKDVLESHGVTQNARVDKTAEGFPEIRVDVQFYKSDPAAMKLVDILEHHPHSLGFSHNMRIWWDETGKGRVAKRVEKGRSLDLVENPATMKDVLGANDTMPEITLEILESTAPDLLREVQEAAATVAATPLNKVIASKDAKIKELEAEIVKKQKAYDVLEAEGKILPELCVRLGGDAGPIKVPDVQKRHVIRDILEAEVDAEGNRNLKEVESLIKSFGVEQRQTQAKGGKQEPVLDKPEFFGALPNPYIPFK